MANLITHTDLSNIHFQILYRRSDHFRLMHDNLNTAPRSGKPLSSFCQIVKSDVSFYTEDGVVTASPGDFVYMPDGIRYYSHWTGYPEIDFISTFFRLTGLQNTETGERAAERDNQFSKALSTAHRSFDQQIAFQKIEELGNFRMKKQMEALLECDRHDPVQHMRALSILYDIFSQAYPYLKMREPQKRFDLLEPALNHLDTYYMLNESVSRYAELCHLSESRFHHLFSQHLHTTPIEYRNMLRIRQAATLLMETNQNIEQISNSLGFQSSIYFRRVFKAMQHCTPGEFRKRQDASR